jgi:hypothetical protein
MTKMHILQKAKLLKNTEFPVTNTQFSKAKCVLERAKLVIHSVHFAAANVHFTSKVYSTRFGDVLSEIA